MSRGANESQLERAAAHDRAKPIPSEPTRTAGSTWLDLHLRPFSRQSGRSKPFAHTGFLMQASTLSEQLAQPGTVTVLRGEPGIGRHTLLDHIAHEIGDSARWLQIDIRPDQDLAAALDRLFPNSPDPADALFETLGGADSPPEQAILVVDNAHLLGAGDLDLLLERLPTAAPQTRTVLLAEPSIERLIGALDSDVVARILTISLLPLRRNQLPVYIAHRLRAAGIHSRSPLGETALRRIYRESGGVPGRINQVAREAFEDLYNSEHQDLDYGKAGPNPATTALLLTSALLLVTVGTWVWVQLDDRETVASRDTLTSRVSSDSDPSPRTAAETPPPALEIPEPPTPVSLAAQEVSTDSTPDPTPVVPSPSSATSNSTPSPQVTAPPAAEAVAPDLDPISVADGSAQGPQDPQWLLTQPEDSYALQVVAVKNLSAIERLCNTVGACRQAAWYTIERDGTTWYRLVVGPYATRDAARSGIDELPATLRAQTPWIRPMRDIQRAISAGSRPPTAGN